MEESRYEINKCGLFESEHTNFSPQLNQVGGGWRTGDGSTTGDSICTANVSVSSISDPKWPPGLTRGPPPPAPLGCCADCVHAHSASSQRHIAVKRTDLARVCILLFRDQATKIQVEFVEKELPLL